MELQVEVFPVGHVLRAGHALVLQLAAPPAADWTNVYASGRPAAVQLLHDPEHPSSLLLPLLPQAPEPGPPPACGAQVAVRCLRPVVP